MKKLRWPLLIVILALVAIGALLLTQKTTVPQDVTGGGGSVNKPASGGIYTEGVIGSLVRLNPVLDLYNSSDHAVDRLLYSGLMRFDDRGLPQGDLAESWGISQDGKVYNFSIRKEANWQDGQPVTSEDIAFTVDLIRADQSIFPQDVRDLWKQVEVKVLDEKTLQFRLPEPFAPFMDYLTFGVLPKHIWDGMSPEELVNAPGNLKPIGSGPYQFERLMIEDGKINGVVLAVNKNYYTQQPFIEHFVVRYYPDGPAALAAYQKGDVMGISNVTADILPDVLKEPNLRAYTGRLPQLSMVFLNLDNTDLPFFKDANVRRALMESLNRQSMIDHLVNSQAIIADGPIFPGTWASFDGVEHLNYDPDDAVKLLQTAGYTIPAEGGSVRSSKDGVSFTFELAYPDDEHHKAVAEFIQKNWQAIGASVTLKPMPYEQLLTDALDQRAYQAVLVDLDLSRSPDPDPYPFWHQAMITGGQNYSKWDNRQASEFLERARVVVDLDERIKMYRNFQVLFAKELPALPLYYPVYTYAVSADVQGVRMGPLFDLSDRFATVTSWFLVTKRSTSQPVMVTVAPTTETTAAPESTAGPTAEPTK